MNSLRRVSTLLLTLLVFAAGCSIGSDHMTVMADAPADDAPAEPERAADAPDSTGGELDDFTAQESGDPDVAETDEPPPVAGDDSAEPVVGGSGLGDIYYPDFGNGGYDVAAYDLDLDWDHEGRVLDAVVTISLTPDQPLSRFNLDFVGFDISSIVVDGVAASFDRDGRELSITPAAPLAADEAVDVAITYRGEPTLLDSEGAPFSTGWTDLGDTIVVVGEPEGAEGWYPVNGHPRDTAIYELSITTDADLTVASNGLLVAEEQNGDTRTSTFRTAHPQASYLTTLAIGDFIYHEGEPSQSGVPVRHYFHEDRFDESVVTMQRTGEMIDFFESLLGPYPFEVYGTIVVDADLGFALETQTISVFGGDLVDRQGTFEDIVVHELAHQWFGNLVTLHQWRDIWLNEGFASYSEYLWHEEVDPGYDIDREIRRDHGNVGFLLDVPPGAPPSDDLFNPSVYLRGAFLLHSLRTTVGDDAFFTILRAWVDEFGGRSATTDEFISLAQDISGRELTDFFDRWLFANEIPELAE